MFAYSTADSRLNQKVNLWGSKSSNFSNILWSDVLPPMYCTVPMYYSQCTVPMYYSQCTVPMYYPQCTVPMYYPQCTVPMYCTPNVLYQCTVPMYCTNVLPPMYQCTTPNVLPMYPMYCTNVLPPMYQCTTPNVPMCTVPVLPPMYCQCTVPMYCTNVLYQCTTPNTVYQCTITNSPMYYNRVPMYYTMWSYVPMYSIMMWYICQSSHQRSISITSIINDIYPQSDCSVPLKCGTTPNVLLIRSVLPIYMYCSYNVLPQAMYCTNVLFTNVLHPNTVYILWVFSLGSIDLGPSFMNMVGIFWSSSPLMIDVRIDLFHDRWWWWLCTYGDHILVYMPGVT